MRAGVLNEKAINKMQVISLVLPLLCIRSLFFPTVFGKSEDLNIQSYSSTISKIPSKFISIFPLDQASIQEHLEKNTF